jgi:hypothetical protein
MIRKRGDACQDGVRGANEAMADAEEGAVLAIVAVPGRAVLPDGDSTLKDDTDVTGLELVLVLVLPPIVELTGKLGLLSKPGDPGPLLVPLLLLGGEELPPLLPLVPPAPPLPLAAFLMLK